MHAYSMKTKGQTFFAQTMMKKARTGTQQYQVSSHDENIHFCAYMQAPAVLET